MRNIQKPIQVVAVFFLLNYTQTIVSAQPASRFISGLVTASDDARPLEGVTVQVKGRQQLSGTQADGVFYINVTNEDSVLVFTCRNFQPAEIRISPAADYNVILRPESNIVTEAGYFSEEAVTVSGQVLSGQSQTPVKNVYVHIIEGEEEDLTGENGEFKIKTWQKFPVKLVLRYLDQPPVAMTITDPRRKYIIRL